MTDTTQKPKDPVIFFRSVVLSKDKKGWDRSQLYLDKEQATKLIESITAQLENPTGVKLDLHTGEKEWQGRKFISGYTFVKPVEERTNATYAPVQAKAPAIEKFKTEFTG